VILRLAAVAVGFALVGCGQDVPAVDVLDGTDVATMAERQLMAENPRMAPGTLTCPDLEFEVGASVRCLRTTELSRGRVVKVAGSVEVTSQDSGGRLHVAMDDEAAEFGLSGDQLAAELRPRFARAGAAPVVECPYLRGAVGQRVTCRVDVGGAHRELVVVVTVADEQDYDVDYEARRLRTKAARK
jgi:hypothetical protein